MTKQRLDKELLQRGLVVSRSQAEDIIRRGFISIKDEVIIKPSFLVDNTTPIKIKSRVSFVSRAGEKLYSVIKDLALDFRDKTILDVGSSTGGFTELALSHGAQKVIAVEIGTEQMHPNLRHDSRVELHEKTDIRNFETNDDVDLVVIDVSFMSLREVLPPVRKLASRQTEIIAMVKPQFEAASSSLKHKGVIKNDHMRRDILKDFEIWASQYFVILGQADSLVAGVKGNVERFYKLRKK